MCESKIFLNLHPFPTRFIIKIIPLEKEKGKTYHTIKDIPKSLIDGYPIFQYLLPKSKNRPENIEVDITKFLNKFTDCTPHIVKYITSPLRNLFVPIKFTS